MNDATGRDIKVGDFIQHKHEPLQPKDCGFKGVGYHAHNLFGVKRVAELCTDVVITEDKYVVLGCLVQVIDNAESPPPHLVSLGETLERFQRGAAE